MILLIGLKNSNLKVRKKNMENEFLEKLIEIYKLSEDEHIIILNELKKRVFLNRATEKAPSIMFVIGQPGCGKTTFIQNTDLSSYTIINSDDYRRFSKYSDEILDKYPTYYTKLTNFDAHLWGDELFSYAIDNSYSALREKAPVDYSLLEIIKGIPDKYDATIDLVVTGNLASLLATRERYEKSILKSKNARLSNIEAHNKCYNLLPDFISRCLACGVKVNYILARNNGFVVIPVENDALNLLGRLRKESNEQVCLDYETRINNIKKAMTNRNAPQEQFDELNKIEKIYLEIVNSKSAKHIKPEDLCGER